MRTFLLTFQDRMMVNAVLIAQNARKFNVSVFQANNIWFAEHCTKLIEYRPARQRTKIEINFNIFSPFKLKRWKFTEEDYDLDMPDGSGAASRVVLKLIHPRIVKNSPSSPPFLLMPSTNLFPPLRNLVQFQFFCYQERWHRRNNFRYCYEKK